MTTRPVPSSRPKTGVIASPSVVAQSELGAASGAASDGVRPASVEGADSASGPGSGADDSAPGAADTGRTSIVGSVQALTCPPRRHEMRDEPDVAVARPTRYVGFVAARTTSANATYADILALPTHVVGEILFGVLHVTPRPAPPHAVAATALGEELGPPFKRGKGGPGGWVLLDEPELHLGEDVVVPDMGGWRRERMPEVPFDKAYFELAPDWVCEVLSPSTEAFDRDEKLRIYGRESVRHVWFVDPLVRTLEVLRLDGSTYRIVAVHRDDAHLRAEPFEAFELELATLWAR